MTPAELCAACGACCDGTLFDAYMTDDGVSHPLSPGNPCHRAGKCDADTRPRACHNFECNGLRALKAGKLTDEEARQRAANKTVHRYGEEKMNLKEKLQQAPKPKINEALVARAATDAITAVTTTHEGEEARLRALQKLAQHVAGEVQTQAAEALAAKGAAARAKRAELAAIE